MVLCIILAALMSAGGTSENARVFRLVNCIERTRPAPNSNTNVTTSGVLTDSKPNPMAKRAINGVFTTNTDRNPNFFNTQVVLVFISKLPIAYTNTNNPDVNGLSPKPVWNINGSSNGAALIEMQLTFPAMRQVAKVRILSSERLISGNRVFRSQ